MILKKEQLLIKMLITESIINLGSFLDITRKKLLPFGECRTPNGDFVFSDYEIYCLNSMV